MPKGRKEPLQDLEQAASDWRRTFDAVELPIVIVDANSRVTRINRSARMLVGKLSGEILGRPIAELGAGEPWPSIADLAGQVRRTRAPAARQVKDPADRTLDLLAMLFNPDDPEDTRVIAMGWDVSALIEMQTRLEQQRSMVTMGALTAGVAHEVRNPLFAISATIDAMESARSSDLGEYFAVLREEIDRLTNLMKDLLAYGGPSAPDFQDASVDTVIERALRASAALAIEHNVTLRKNVSDDVTIVADRERLSRAIQNIIDNAIQHSPPDEEVTVTAARRKRGQVAELEISVIDHGPGFAADVMPRVFEPFFSRRRGGTGLGLSLVQQIVTEHGGRIEMANRAQGGAAVTVTLPLRL